MQAKTNDFRNEHRRRLAEHSRLRFDPTDAPAKNAQGVDHGRMRIRAHHRIGIGFKPVAVRHRANNSREVFQVYLMANAGIRRNDFEILKRGLSPSEKRVALDVALKLQLSVQPESVDAAKIVDLHGMIDDQLGREQRIDSLRAPAHALHCFSHGGQVHNRRDAGEVLQQHTRGHEGNLFFRSPGPPACQRADVLGMDKTAILAAQQILQKYAQ